MLQGLWADVLPAGAHSCLLLPVQQMLGPTHAGFALFVEGCFLPCPKQTEHQGKMRGVATVALSPICGRAQAYAQHRTAHWGTSASRSGTAQGTGGHGWARPTAPQNISYQEY